MGFWELLRKILGSAKDNFGILTSIWKVYQVLLEYCCKTDYRILLTDLAERHNKELHDIESKYKNDIQEYINNEKILRENMSTMRDYNEQLEREKANEKQLRLKLEEENMQNTKNHEEEVKLRLKFEGKFNKMLLEHREL